MFRRRFFAFIAGTAYFGLMTAAPAQEDADSAMFGEWDIVEMVFRTKIQDFGGPTGGTIKIEKGKLLLKYRDFKAPVEFQLTLRPMKSPKELDVRFPGDKEWIPGLYEIKDGVLRIIWCNRGPNRPTSFEAQKNEDWTLYILKKPK